MDRRFHENPGCAWNPIVSWPINQPVALEFVLAFKPARNPRSSALNPNHIAHLGTDNSNASNVNVSYPSSHNRAGLVGASSARKLGNNFISCPMDGRESVHCPWSTARSIRLIETEEWSQECLHCCGKKTIQREREREREGGRWLQIQRSFGVECKAISVRGWKEENKGRLRRAINWLQQSGTSCPVTTLIRCN